MLANCLIRNNCLMLANCLIRNKLCLVTLLRTAELDQLHKVDEQAHELDDASRCGPASACNGPAERGEHL